MLRDGEVLWGHEVQRLRCLWDLLRRWGLEPEDYEAPPGFPRLALVFQTYSSNNFFTGENSERNLQLMASRREQYESLWHERRAEAAGSART